MNWDDPDMIADFLVEAEEHLDEIDSILLEIESGRHERKLLSQLTGTFHTLKGMASYVDFKDVQQLCHHIETVLTAEAGPSEAAWARNTDLAFDVVSVLRQRFAEVEDCLDSQAPMPESPGVKAMLARLSQVQAPGLPKKRRA